MAKLAAISAKYSAGGALEAYLSGVTQNVTQTLVQAQSLADVGPVRLAETYDWNQALSGNFDPTGTTGPDAILFGALTSAGVSLEFDPTGAGSAAADAPIYTGTGLLESYIVTVALGSPDTFSATFQGASALSREVS